MAKPTHYYRGYKLIIEKSKSGKFIGTIREFQYLIVQEKTAFKCRNALKQCLDLVTAMLKPSGLPLPNPLSE